MDNRGRFSWDSAIPWFTTAMSVVLLIALAAFLVENIFWFRANARVADPPDAAYLLYVFQLHSSLIKRSVGLLSGFSMLFIGTSIVFYTARNRTAGSATIHGVTLQLATYSPGIVAMVLGATLVAFTIQSKDTFPRYDGAHTKTQERSHPVPPQDAPARQPE